MTTFFSCECSYDDSQHLMNKQISKCEADLSIIIYKLRRKVSIEIVSSTAETNEQITLN